MTLDKYQLALIEDTKNFIESIPLEKKQQELSLLEKKNL